MYLHPGSYEQAYGEVFWFGGRVTGLTVVSFLFMVSRRYISNVKYYVQKLMISDVGLVVCYCRMGRYQ